MKRLLAPCLAFGALSAVAATAATAGVTPGNPPVSKLTILHQFSTADGYGPTALFEGAPGVFYGVTNASGPRNGGTVYKVSSAGDFSLLFAFADQTSGLEGYYPIGSLVRGPDGHLYGSTTQGGNLNGTSGGYGTLFRMTDSGDLTVLHTFTGPDGGQPWAAMLVAADGHLYGTTYQGTVFRLNADDTITTIYTFPADATAGGGLTAPLLQAPDGTLYSSASRGGCCVVPNTGGGTVFQLTLDGVLTTLHYFPYLDGVSPVAFGADGALYGTEGGTGTLFRVTTTGRFLTLYQFPCFCGEPVGSAPSGQLVLASDGNFYGTTSAGGVNNAGTIYSLTPDGVLSTVYTFDASGPGVPAAGVIEGQDGRFYGTTAKFGTSNYGAVFKIAFLPKAPADVTATAGDGHVQLTWTAPKATDSYQVFVGQSASAEASAPAMSGITDTKADVGGLTNGVTYYFTVAAVNEAGTGTHSTEVSALTVGATPPSTPPPTNSPPATTTPPAAAPGGGGGGSIDLSLISALGLLGSLSVWRRRIDATTVGARATLLSTGPARRMRGRAFHSGRAG
jgi:uncharacterized repeat protein (TIGR03803 family)